jgi:hypothetical protein
MSTLSPFANSIRQQPMLSHVQPFDKSQFGIGALFKRLAASQPTNNAPLRQLGVAQRNDEPDEDYNVRSGLTRAPQQPAQPTNPFEGNEQYQALMEYQQSLAPNQEQQARLQELRSAFEGTGGYKDYRINQLQNQFQQRQRNPMMGMGLGGMRPMGMQPYQNFGRPPMQQRPMQNPMPVPRGGYLGYNQMMNPQRQFGAMGYNQPQPYQQQSGIMGGYGMSPYQQMRPQPQQFGGYGMGQSMGGYGGYGGMSNPYQPQQMGSYNPNNFMGYLQ